MNGFPSIPSVLEYCRFCNEKKAPFVDIFSTMVFRDGCSLAKKLNELYGIEASSPDDDLSKFICVECLRQVMRHGNLTYNLWSTLDYLLRMHAEKVMDVTSFDIPADSLDFLFSREMDCSLQPLVLEKKNQPYASRVSSCGNKDRGSVARTFMTEKAGSEMEEKEKLPKVEFCWCNECNEEFITREDLRLHTKKHAETGTRDGFEQNEDLILSSEEYKLLSGEVSLLKNKLCCSKCQKEFKSEKKLVRHVKKYDFQCEHRSFVNLNNHLKSLKSNRAEDSALMNTQGKDGTFHVNYKLCEATSPLTRDLSDNSNGDLVNNKYISDNGVEAGVSDVSYKVKQRKFHEKLPSHVGSLPSMVSSCDQDEVELKTISKEGAEIVNLDTSTTALNLFQGVVVCDYCTKPHFSKSKLREHIVVCHLSIVTHWCSICHTHFSTESELKVHEAIHFSKSKYICSLCYKNFSFKAKVLMHMKNAHNMDRPHTCSTCFVCFPSHSELGLHQLCHSSDKKYCCSKCGKRFMVKWYYRAHVRVCQSGELLHECGLCGKGFMNRNHLKMHSLSHNPEQRFACHLCPKRYSYSCNLSSHIRNFHLKLKLYECGICKKRFNFMGNLRVHYSVHSDHRAFKCQHCEKSYKTKTGVYRHTKEIHV
ncbi:zinc finger protein 569-like isoform X8 [Ischnura elegans]|uniref:zinc finger protein 569-like isoform X8 n=1 Tax=Ischnura elegans TaxID=197161 RepID=UPI001ED8730A|nr:zinc finger protein 569-like isoform X8 [Ischnura elegans]